MIYRISFDILFFYLNIYYDKIIYSESSDNMEFLKEIKEDTVLIIPNVLKNKVLRYIDTFDKLVNIKIYSLDEVKKHLYFSYDEKSILYLMDKYNYKYEVSKTLIDNMYYLENKKYSSNKLNELLKLKEELEELSLLKKDNLFFNYLNSKKIIVYGYDFIDKFNKRMLSRFNDVEYKEVTSKYNNNVVYSNNTIFDEVNFVMNKVSNLIEEGIDINKIKLTNVDSNYYHSLLTLSKFYNIPTVVGVDNPVISTKLGNLFLNILNLSNNLEQVIKQFTSKVNIDENNSNIYNKIVNICNKYIDLDYSYSSVREAIIYDLKNTNINLNNLDNYLEIVPFKDNAFNDDEYIFFMGFNQGVTPTIYKDEDYISDNLKTEVELDLTNEKNSKNKEAFIKKINSIKNLVISYKLKSITEEFYPSNLIKELNMEETCDNLNTKYSEEYSKIILGTMLDELIKFDVKHSDLDKYYSNVNIPYMDYDNKFTGIKKESLLKMINNKLLLSYSTIDNYYRCAFRYYISNILKLDVYEEKFKTYIGNLFHYVLSKSLDDNFDFELEWNNYISDKKLLKSEEFFLIKLKEELRLIINNVKKMHNETGLTSHMLEQKIYIDKTRDIPITFMGIVDKIMYKNVSGEDLISIVDYKTGNPNTNLFNCIYGIDMQLPIYLYLVKYSTLFSNPSFVGFYLQKILHGEITKSPNKTYLEQKEDNLKLNGYSSTDLSKLSRFDPTYENSDFIKGMKISSKGFYAYAKVIEDDKIKLLIELVNKKIDDAITDILSCKFDINPKRVGTENIGCSFCKFRDICYLREENIVNLKEYKDFGFLGGSNNA